jgi:hypothetical protein
VGNPRYRGWTFAAAVIAAVLLAASPADAVDRDGSYRGLTSQDRRIRFVVEGGAIGNVRLSIFHEPCNLTVVATSGGTTFQIEDDNTFVMRFFARDRRDNVVVRGEFTGRNRARGTLRSAQADPGCSDVVRGNWRAVRV